MFKDKKDEVLDAVWILQVFIVIHYHLKSLFI